MKPASPAQVDYALRLLARVRPVDPPSEDEVRAMDMVTIGTLIGGLLQARGRPTYYGNGTFDRWDKSASRVAERYVLAALADVRFGTSAHVAVRDLPPTLQRALKEVGYARRDVEVRARESVTLQDMGGDGYRGFASIVNLETGATKVLRGSWGGPNPWSRDNAVDLDDRKHAIPLNGAVVQGREGGTSGVYATVTVNPGNVSTLLPSKPELTDDEDWALAVVSGLKPSYRAEYFDRRGLGEYGPHNPVVRSLAAKGLLRVTGAGVQITTDGKNAVNPRLRP